MLNPMRLLLFLLTAATGVAQVQYQSRPGDVVIRGGWLFDSLRDGVRRNTGIVVRNGEFLEVDAALAGRDFATIGRYFTGTIRC